MSSIREIAKQTGFSPTTVSRALKLHPDISAETRQRVVSAANAAGYAVPSSARTDQGVGLMVASHHALSFYDCLLLNGIRRGLQASKLDVQFIDAGRDKAADQSYTAFFQQRGIWGVITLPGSNDPRVCGEITREGFPHIAIGARFDEPDLNYVCCDFVDASTRAVEHLLDLGHTRIGLAIPPTADHDHHDRQEGYRRAHESRGVTPDPAHLIHVDPMLESGGAAINQFLSQRTPPTAIYFADPYPAIGALARAREMGLSVPGALSIVGCDDGRMRRQVYPLLTAVVQPTEELGHAAGQWMAARLAGWSDEVSRRSLLATLEINQTSGRPEGAPVRMQPDGSLLAAASL